MADEKKPFVPFTTEQKREYGKQFSPAEKTSYRKGQRNAYSHMANTARRESFFVGDNLKKDGAATPPTVRKLGKELNNLGKKNYSAPPAKPDKTGK